MTFENLPSDWSTRPVDDPEIVADVLDLFVSLRDRCDGGIVMLLCDDEGRLVQPTAISAIGRPSFDERVTVFGNVRRACEKLLPVSSVLLAIARPDGLSVTRDDEQWFRAAELAFAPWRILGVHVVTVHASRPVPRPVAA